MSWHTETNAWLTTVGPTGAPQTTRVWFAVVDDRAWVGSGDSSVKWRNLSRDPRVTLALDGPNAGVITGVASLHTPATDYPDAVAALAAKYSGWDATADEPGWGTRVLISVPTTPFRPA